MMIVYYIAMRNSFIGNILYPQKANRLGDNKWQFCFVMLFFIWTCLIIIGPGVAGAILQTALTITNGWIKFGLLKKIFKFFLSKPLRKP